MLKNAAVFVNGVRTIRGVNVDWSDTEIRIHNRSNNALMSSYEIVEVASSNQDDTRAWDVHDKRGILVRVTAQVGCGCKGMKSYTNDESYSGALSRK